MNESPPFLPGLPKTTHQLSKNHSKCDDIKLRAIPRNHKTDKKSPPPRSLYRLRSAPNTYDSLPTTAHRNLERASNRREMNQDQQANLAKPVPYIETISRYLPLPKSKTRHGTSRPLPAPIPIPISRFRDPTTQKDVTTTIPPQ